MRTRNTVLVEKQGEGIFDLYSNDTALEDSFDWKHPLTGYTVIRVKPGEVEECGSCDHYHRTGWFGDCRDDNERFVRVN